MFLVRALTGFHLYLHALFSQQVGAQGKFFACVSCLRSLGLSFEPLAAALTVVPIAALLTLLNNAMHLVCHIYLKFGGTTHGEAVYSFPDEKVSRRG